MSFCRSNLARYSGLPFDLAFLTRPTKLLLSYFLNCFLTTRYAYTSFALSTSRIKHRFRSKHISALTTAFTLSAFRSEAPSCGGASNWIMKQEAILRFSCYASAIMLQLLPHEHSQPFLATYWDGRATKGTPRTKLEQSR